MSVLCYLNYNNTAANSPITITPQTTFEELKTLTQVNNNSNVKIMYKDDEDDFVTLSSDLELNEAYQFALNTTSSLSLYINTDLPVEKKNFDEEEAEVEAEKEEEKAVTAVPTVTEPESTAPVAHAACCNACNENIFGIRYKCANCPNYDLCGTCEAENVKSDGKVHNADHVFLKLHKGIHLGHRAILPNLYLPPPCMRVKVCKQVVFNNNVKKEGGEVTRLVTPPKPVVKPVDKLDRIENQLIKLTEELNLEKERRKKCQEAIKKKTTEQKALKVAEKINKLTEKEGKKVKQLEFQKSKIEAQKTKLANRAVKLAAKVKSEVKPDEQPADLPPVEKVEEEQVRIEAVVEEPKIEPVVVEEVKVEEPKVEEPKFEEPADDNTLRFEDAEELADFHMVEANPVFETLPEEKQEEKQAVPVEEEKKAQEVEEEKETKVEEEKVEVKKEVVVPAHLRTLVGLLCDMGMNDIEQNVKALTTANGSIELAIAIILGEEEEN